MNDAPGSAQIARRPRILPILDWLPTYDRRRLRPDLLAGCVVAALAVPQSLGYAAIAGVPVEMGLYAVPVALVAYVVFGTSRQLVIGPVSTLSVMSGALGCSAATSGLAVAGSLSKTAAVDQAGGRSQIAGLSAAVLSLLAILLVAPTLGQLPKAVLSAIVVHAVWGLIDLPAMRRYRRSRRIDFLSAVVAVVGCWSPVR